MGEFFKRVLAYIIDIVVVGLFATLLSNIGFLNWQLDDYTEVYAKYSTENKEYNKFTEDFEKYYKDKKITTEELKKIEDKYKTYYDLVEKKYDDEKITKSEYNSILEDAKDKFNESYKKYYYEIKKQSIASNIIYIVVILLYFVVFQLMTNGQTLGKKIMKLKVSSIKEDKVSVLQYFIRAIVLYNTLFYLADIIIALTVSKGNSYNVYYAVGLIQNIIEWIILFMIAMNKDGRGLHDVLAGTVVTKANGESLNMNNYQNNTSKEEVKEDKKIIEAEIEEIPKKKTTTTKKSTSKTTTDKKNSTTKKTNTTKKETPKKTITKTKTEKKTTKKES